MAKRRHPVRNLLIVLGLIALSLAGCVLFYQLSLSPVSQNEESVSFSVDSGETFDEIARKLEEDGLIRSSFVARIYRSLHGVEDQYAGHFVLSASMSTPEILEWLANPDNAQAGYVIVTEPEGTWAKELAQHLESQFPQYSAQDFLDLWNDSSFLQEVQDTYEWFDVKQIPEDVYVRLEGYLFPETYYMDPDFDPAQITYMFLDQFDLLYQQIKTQVRQSDLSLEEIVTLASIVQFESGQADQMPEIARVFFNRMEQGMPLGSSVTVCYALYEDFEQASDCETNTEIDSPYNTYIHTGLPIGPILNPGREAIEAVLSPADNDYLYFVSDIYGDGSIHYATTYEEHLANMEKYHLVIE